MKNIIFLFSGTSRTSPFNIKNEKRKMEILDSYNKYIFTDKFKSLYNYKIYISTDDINLVETIDYFKPENIGNIYLQDTDFYLKNVEKKTPNIKYFLDIFDQQYDDKYMKWTNSIFQHQKLLSCYNLFRNDNFENVDYIIRLRMDVKINDDIINILHSLETSTELQIIMDWDLHAIGKPKIMECYFTGLENNYGNYKNTTIVPDILPIMPEYKNLDMYVWMYAPERQLFEMLFEYCNNNELDINNTILSLNFTNIVRYLDETHGLNIAVNNEYII